MTELLKAVQLSYERHNISELARELGITPQLYKWRKEYEVWTRKFSR
jgi:transposase